MSGKKQINELKKIIQADEKKVSDSLPTGDILGLVIIALIAVAALSMSIYTYEDNKDKPSDAFTSIGITHVNDGIGIGGPLEAEGKSRLNIVSDTGICISGTGSTKTLTFLNTGAGASGTPGLPDKSIQFRKNATTFGGSPSFKFESDLVTAPNVTITGGLSASGFTYPASGSGSVGQFLKLTTGHVLQFDTAPSGIGYGASSGLSLSGTSFSVVAGQGIDVNSAGVCVRIGNDQNLFFRAGGALGVSEILTGVSYQGRPIEIEYGGTGITSIGTSQFFYSADGTSISPIGLSGGTNIDLDYVTYPNFITINSTGGGGGSGGGTSLGDLTDTKVDTSNLILGNTAPNLDSDRFNTGVGISALFSLTGTGVSNTALGYDAAKSLTSGDSNIAIGVGSLITETIGNYSTAVGFDSLKVQAGISGNDAYNTAVGYNAGLGNASGYQNTFIGACTGTCVTGITGHNITCLGYGAQPSSVGVSNEITLGNNQIDTLRSGETSITSLSDRRDKTDIRDTIFGLDFLEKVRPVDFTWNRRVLQEGDENHPKNGKRRTGFIAQELLEASGEEGNQILDLVYQSNPERIEAKYGNLIPSMVKSIQELSKKVESLEKRLEKLE